VISGWVWGKKEPDKPADSSSSSTSVLPDIEPGPLSIVTTSAIETETVARSPRSSTVNPLDSLQKLEVKETDESVATKVSPSLGSSGSSQSLEKRIISMDESLTDTPSKITSSKSGDTAVLRDHKRIVAEKAKHKMEEIKTPRGVVEEYTQLRDSHMDDIITQIDSAEDIGRADQILEYTSQTVSKFQNSLAEMERVRATGRGKKESTSLLELVQRIWNTGGVGGRRYFPSDIYGLIF